jgi:hypothetical protein
MCASFGFGFGGCDFIKLEMEKIKNSDNLDGDPSETD